MNPRGRRNSQGFSAAELLIVIAIIGLVVAVSVPLAANQVKTARARSAADTLGVDLRAARMLAGTIVVRGRAGRGTGISMRRGTLLVGRLPALPATFADGGPPPEVFLRLLQRHLRDTGGPQLECTDQVGGRLDEDGAARDGPVGQHEAHRVEVARRESARGLGRFASAAGDRRELVREPYGCLRRAPCA